jgi:hypothetical protein
MTVTRADPELLRGYAATTLARLDPTRAALDAYAAAVRRLRAAPSDLPVPVPDRAPGVARDLDDLAVVDRQPALLATVLELADRTPWPITAAVRGTAGSGSTGDPGPTSPRVADAIADLQVALALPAGTRLAAVRAAFDGLGDGELDEVADTVPWLVGSLDGAPTRVRYRANLLLIRTELDATRARHAATGDAALEPRITALEQLLEERTDPVTLETGPRRFLVFDPTGLGRVAEVYGDLDAAAHVSVSVPGMTSKLDGYFDGFTRDVRALAAEAARHEPGVAAIAWQGYTAPQGASVLRPDLAVDGAEVLDAFLAGLPPTGAGTTLIGHSYGSRLLGEAIVRLRLEPDAVVLLGSPGVGAGHVGELGLPAGTPVYAARAPFDAVVTFGNHGPDPTDPRFGATRIRTEHHELGDGLIWWHSSYYAPDTHALRNLAHITTGRHDLVTVVEPSLADRLVVAADGTLVTVRQVREAMTRRAERLAEHPLLPRDVRAALKVYAGTATVAERVTTTVLGAGLTVFDKVTDLADDGHALAPQVVAAGTRRLAEWADGTVDWVGGRWDDASDWATDRWDDATGWATDRRDDATRWLGDRLEDVGRWLP